MGAEGSQKGGVEARESLKGPIESVSPKAAPLDFGDQLVCRPRSQRVDFFNPTLPAQLAISARVRSEAARERGGHHLGRLGAQRLLASRICRGFGRGLLLARRRDFNC
jgi:hypothetical protein